MSAAAPTKPQGSSGYELGRPTGKCSITGADIGVGDKFMAALRETPTGFERLDISMTAWPEFDRKDVIGFWQTTMPAAEQKKKLFVDDEVLCELFERLKDTEEPGKLNFRFVLGLILMRKKLLIYDGSRHEENKDIWTLHFKGKEEKLDLVDPKLNESAMTEVSQQLSQILNEEL
ncbi:MAG TPA: hypothetical protein VF669_13395 [Tepidisphaeraceae bacterium]|jgi:hypothetical protein